MPVPVFTSGEILTAANMNQVGVWLLKTQTIGSGVGSVSVTSVFSSSWDNYRIVFTVNSMNTNGNTIALTLDSTNITANYYTGGHYNFYNAGTYYGTNVNNGSSWQIGYTGTDGGGGTIDICNPNLAQKKSAQSQTAFSQICMQANHFNPSTSQATGFTITPSGSTFTGGTIRVYGYRN